MLEQVPKLQFLGSNHSIALRIDRKLSRGGPKIRARKAPLVIHNSGRHLYANIGVPHWYEPDDQPFTFLSYREYCGAGKGFNGVWVQHLGHLYGVNGGPALARLSYRGSVFEFVAEPCKLYFIVDGRHSIALCVKDNFVVLPRKLLPMGR